MQYRSAVLMFVLLAAPAAIAQDRTAESMLNPPSGIVLPAEPVEAPMDMAFGKPAVEVLINGRGPFELLIDTGASPTLILNSDLAEELGLEAVGSSRVGDPTDPQAIAVDIVPVDSVSLGGAVFEGISAISWDRSTLYAGEDAPRGILGFPLFRDVLVTFDYPGGMLRVEGGSLEPGPHTVGYDAPMGVPMVPFAIGGQTHHAHLDSGSMASLMLPMGLAASIELDSEPKEVSRARTVNSEFAILAADFSGGIMLAGHEVRAEQLLFTEVMPDPNIGSQVLGAFAVTFDQQHALVRFERSGEGPAVVARQRGGLGIQLARRGTDYLVAGTVEGSPAAASGLREGDRLVAVNGKPVADLAPGDFAVEMRRPVVELTIDRDGDLSTVRIEPVSD